MRATSAASARRGTRPASGNQATSTVEPSRAHVPATTPPLDDARRDPAALLAHEPTVGGRQDVGVVRPGAEDPLVEPAEQADGAGRLRRDERIEILGEDKRAFPIDVDRHDLIGEPFEPGVQLSLAEPAGGEPSAEALPVGRTVGTQVRRIAIGAASSWSGIPRHRGLASAGRWNVTRVPWFGPKQRSPRQASGLSSVPHPDRSPSARCRRLRLAAMAAMSSSRVACALRAPRRRPRACARGSRA